MKKQEQRSHVSLRERMLYKVGGSIVVTGLVSGGLVYWGVRNHYENILAQTHSIFAPTTQYKFLHPIIGIALPSGQFDDGFPDVRGDIKSFVSTLPAGTLSRYSVYVRDFNSENWTGINENDLYNPASMLKVVIAIATYRQIENQPRYASTQLVYTSDLAEINKQLPFALPSALHIGQAYSIQELVKRVLTDSDNGAANILLNFIVQKELDEVYNDLSLPLPSTTDSTKYKLSARNYSRFFRILYNGTLSLSWVNAEKILENLTESTFVSGLVAGVPSTIPVAHKYGEHINSSNGGVNDIELSDCGIVYYTPRPYFLCVMTEGENQSALENVITQISRVVYQKISASQ